MTTHNWEYGKRGFQPSLDKAQRLELLLVLSQNEWKLTPARTMLKQRYRVELNTRTLGRYKKDLKKRWENSTSDLDKPANWIDFPTLARYGVPTQHLRELHRMSQVSEDASEQSGIIAIKETYRTLRWQGYMIEYYGDIITNIPDRQYVASIYSLREMADDLFDLPMVYDDLDRWLYYQPWEGGEKESSYLRDIDKSLIPSLDLTFTQNASLPVTGIWKKKESQFRGLTLNMISTSTGASSCSYYGLLSQLDMAGILKRWGYDSIGMLKQREDNSVIYLEELEELPDKQDNSGVVYLEDTDFSWYQKNIIEKFPELRREQS